MKEQEFDHIVKQKLEAVSDAPPAYMWDRIAAGIPAAAVPVAQGITTSVKIALVAASVVIIGGLSFLLLQNNSTIKRNALENKKYQNTDFAIKKRQLPDENNYSQDVIVGESSNQLTKKNSESGVVEAKTNTTHAAVNQTTKNTTAIESNQQNSTFNKTIPLTNTALILKSEQKNPKKQKVNTLEKEAKKEEMSYEVAVASVMNNEPAPKNEVANTVNPNQETTVEKLTETAKTIEPQEATPEEIEITKTPITEKASQKEPTAEKQEAQMAKGTPSQEEVNLKQENPKNRQLNKYGIGLHYGPEFMDMDGVKLSDQAFDISFNYQNLNFILQTGLGLRFSQDKVNYDMEYQRWDYLETQLRFDSAIFVLDQNGNPVLQPINPYYEEVYDSLSHEYHATASVKSSILQIPLLVGYQVDYKRFAYFVKGGVRYSLVVYTHTSGLYELDDRSQMTNLIYPDKKRVKSNIDYELSLGGIYKINKNFQIHAEAFGRYYHYSIYEENPPSGIHPWSVSGRIGLVYILR